MAGNSKNKRKSAGVRKTLLSKSPVVIRESEADQRLLKLQPHISLEAFRTRTAKLFDWNTVCTRLNIGFNLAVAIETREAVNVLAESLETILKIHERFMRTRKWQAGDPEINTLHIGLGIVDDLQDITTRREQLDAYTEVVALMKRYKYAPIPGYGKKVSSEVINNLNKNACVTV